MCSDGAGGLYLAWTDGGPLGRILATRLDGTGRVVAPWRLRGSFINSGTGGLYFPQVADDGAGGFYATWLIANVDMERATHIRADTTRAPGWPLDGMPLCTDGPDTCQYVEPSSGGLVSNGTGGAVAVWQEERAYAMFQYYSFERPYAQGIGVNGPVATLVSLVDAEATESRARVEWQVSEGGAWDVERAVGASGGWSLFQRVAPDGQDRIAVEDRDVRPGERYGYRLARGESSARETLGETWLDIPRPGDLRVASVRPNPTSGQLVLAISLQDASPASLEVFDAAGRRITARRLQGLGAGAHDVRLEESAGLPSGVYLVRLSQGGRSVATRACLVR